MLHHDMPDTWNANYFYCEHALENSDPRQQPSQEWPDQDLYIIATIVETAAGCKLVLSDDAVVSVHCPLPASNQ